MAQISLTFPDGNAREVAAGITPAEVAADISTSLAKKAISATVNGAHWDLQWPIEGDAQIAINTMKDDAPALELIRHDLAHIMARAVQEIWPDVKVTIGPVIENGFYYDFAYEPGFTPEDLDKIGSEMRRLVKDALPVERTVMGRGEAIQHFRQKGEEFDLRVSTVPTLYGESVVIRLLDQAGEHHDLPARQGQGVDLLVIHHLHVEIVFAKRRIGRQVIEQRLDKSLQGLVFQRIHAIDEMLTEPDFHTDRDLRHGDVGGHTEQQVKDQDQQQQTAEQPAELHQRVGLRDVDVFFDVLRCEFHGRFMTTAVP